MIIIRDDTGRLLSLTCVKLKRAIFPSLHRTKVMESIRTFLADFTLKHFRSIFPELLPEVKRLW